MALVFRNGRFYHIDEPPPGSVAEKIRQARGHRSRPATAREIKRAIQKESSERGPLRHITWRLWRHAERAARRRERGH